MVIKLEGVRIGIAIDRVAEGVGLPVEVGDHLVALTDLRPAVGEVEVVAFGVRGKRGNFYPQPGIFKKIGKIVLVTTPIVLFVTKSAKL